MRYKAFNNIYVVSVCPFTMNTLSIEYATKILPALP